MLRLTPPSSTELTAMVCPMPMELTPMLDMPMELTPMLMELTVSPSDTPLVKTPSLRDSSPRGPLMLMLLSSMEPMVTPTPMPMFLSDPALDLTPSPRDLTLPPRDMSPTMDTDTTPMESNSSINIKPNKLLFMIAATDNCNIQ